MNGLNALYPCVPNQETTKAEGVVKPTGQPLTDAAKVTKEVLKNLTPWQWAFLLIAGYLAVTELGKKRR